MIRFNKPYLSGKELYYISKAVNNGKLSGNQEFSKKCHEYFRKSFGFTYNLITTSCTDALEMAAILSDIQVGDEIIMPSYTFVSTANAFILKGAIIRFVDSCPNNPNIDPTKIEELISDKTKAIVIVHYAGVACDMDAIVSIAEKHNLLLIEDAAQAIDSYYKDKVLGTFGDFAAFSFHETKNIICGEGGLLVVKDHDIAKRAEIIWEKGTNRSAFFRGEVDKYGWVDMGSSFLPSDILAAFLYAQLEHLQDIQSKRTEIWNRYHSSFEELELSNNIQRPTIPSYATNNAHMYYIVLNNLDARSAFIKYLKGKGIHAVFHYLSLHKSQFYKDKHDGRELEHCDRYANCLVRLPLFYELELKDQEYIIATIIDFFKQQ